MNYSSYMELAINEAYKALEHGDIPVGAVAVYRDEVIASAHNQKEIFQDPMAHAEVLALKKAADILKTWRLKGVTLFVTMEPCPMCAGAILQSRIDTLVYGCWDLKWGACGSTVNLLSEGKYNHNVQVIAGILEDRCRELIQNVF